MIRTITMTTAMTMTRNNSIDNSNNNNDHSTIMAIMTLNFHSNKKDIIRIMIIAIRMTMITVLNGGNADNHNNNMTFSSKHRWQQ